VILLKLKSSKIKFASLEILTAPRLPDNLQFLNIRVLKDVRLLMKANEELPFTISPTIKFVSLVRLDKLAGIGPSKEFPWSTLQVHAFRKEVIPYQIHL